ncbi:MAG: LacI family DNA-binding transcriptional regulator [Spirochaetes bacterium]|nr:LacI family DNA-binding transcriptional regulator [Spirochaetota bacterium]
MSDEFKKVTIYDIAQAAGVAYSTVSTVLSGNRKNYLSEKTRSRILALAEEMNYIPSHANRILKGIKTNTAAIVISSPAMAEQEHIRSIILRLTEKLRIHEYAAYVSYFLPDCDRSHEIRKLIQRGCDAFYFASSIQEYSHLCDEITGHGKTYVTYGYASPRSITVDITGGVTEILKSFIGSGRNNFRMIMPAHDMNENDRAAALRTVFPDRPFEEVHRRYVVSDDSRPYNPEKYDTALYFETGYKLTQKALTDDPGIQAFFYFSDHYAAGGIRALSEAGIKPIKDVLIAGVNNTQISQFGNPPFTSIGYDIEAVVDAVVDNLFGNEPVSINTRPVIYWRQ